MDIKDIKKIIELMKSNELSEFELEEEGFRIALKRGNGIEQQLVVSTPASAPAQVPSSAMQSGTPGAPAPGAEAAAAVDDHLAEITSPMVGTFYRSPSPDADSFVSVGDTVDEETVVCIIEAMKVMNEIKADTKGTIRKILVENGAAVEFGQPLFLVEPS